MTLACKIFGHRPVFRVDGRIMRWECERGCAEGHGFKEYNTAAEARRYAAAFNRRDTDDVGKRAPFVGLFPLRLWRRFSRHAR